MKENSKHRANRLHFISRLKLRKRVFDLTLAEEVEIADMCRSGKYLVERISVNRSMHKFTFRGIEMTVIYDSKHENCITVY